MYLKLIITGNIINNTGTTYAAFSAFKFYDDSNNILTGLSATNNIISQTYTTRNSLSSCDLWFNWNGANLTPYNTTNVPVTVIIKLPVNVLNKIDFWSYQNTGAAKTIDVYASKDNINYNFVETVTFSSANQVISTMKKIMFYKYLIKGKNNILYTFDGSNIIESQSQILDSNNFNSNGFDNPTIISEEIWNNIFPDKTGLQLLMYTDDTIKTEVTIEYNVPEYRPIDKLEDQFQIKKYIPNS